MNFLKYLNEDDGTVSSGNIANVRGSLFGGMITRKGTRKRKKKLTEMDHNNEFSASDVISKIDNVSKKSEHKKNTACYGLEDSDGNITKIYVDKDQADEFKEALDKLLDDEHGKNIDVAEILFNLRHTFKIVDVEWPKDIEEDEEVTNKLDGQNDEKPSDLPQEVPPTDPAADAAMPPMPEEEPSSEIGEPADNTSILMKVIDLLKADTDAKKAESDAKKAESEMRQQKLSMELTNQKISHEEQLLKSEDYFKQQNEKKKEDDRLAKLAKYRHEVINQQQFESNDMSLLNIFPKSIMNEDANDDINRLKIQMSDLQVRKARAVKIFDDQMNTLQKQLLQKQKTVSATQPQMNQPMQQPQPQI
jgi:hypothetical protein